MYKMSDFLYGNMNHQRSKATARLRSRLKWYPDNARKRHNSIHGRFRERRTSNHRSSSVSGVAPATGRRRQTRISAGRRPQIRPLSSRKGPADTKPMVSIHRCAVVSPSWTYIDDLRTVPFCRRQRDVHNEHQLSPDSGDDLSAPPVPVCVSQLRARNKTHSRRAIVSILVIVNAFTFILIYGLGTRTDVIPQTKRSFDLNVWLSQCRWQMDADTCWWHC